MRLSVARPAQICVLFALFLCGCDQRNQVSDSSAGLLVRAAREAKAKGEAATSIHAILDENGAESTLDELTTEGSVVLVSALKSPAGTSRDDDFIVRWHLLQVHETLWSATESGDYCERQPASPLAAEPNEMALSTPGGSAVIEGVTVTMTTDVLDLRFDEGERYLLIAVVCRDRTALLPQGAFDVFDVDEAGRITAQHPSNFAFAVQLRALGSLEQVRSYFRDKERRQR